MHPNLLLFTSDDCNPRAFRRYCLTKLLPSSRRALILFGPDHPDGPTRLLDTPPTDDEAEVHRANRYFGAWHRDEGALIEGRYVRLTTTKLDGLVRSRRIGLVVVEDLRAIDHEAPMDALETIAGTSPAIFAVRALASTLRGRPVAKMEYHYPVDPAATVPEAGVLLDGKVALTWTHHI